MSFGQLGVAPGFTIATENRLEKVGFSDHFY